MNDFEEYIKQGEPQKKEKGYTCSRITITNFSKCKNTKRNRSKVQNLHFGLHFGRNCSAKLLERTS